MNKKTIIIVDDHRVFHHGISQALEATGEFTVTARAANGIQAVSLAEKSVPDLILMDISMPDLNGMEATRRILAIHPKIRIIALSMHTEKIYVKGMLNAGASGYVLKSCSFKELLTAIKAGLDGHVYVSPEITHLLVGDSPDRLSCLTPREKQILVYIAEGHSTRETAEILKLSAKTIDIHRRNLRSKLGIQTVAGLTRYALAKGLIPPAP
ncbi:response regulator [Desulfotignum phosphitoxidans]|jgi:DNA-binding NarL/FixJ family response regulator|uniref:Two component transcriptional regulator, LuxR family n=2 Tax=Desulfotignum TaxID=115780 RepID=S0G5P2_9BACT|nr:response regulator transcription factor [Desulfotignum phosphitoxidans]EMS81214.1 two component transcriptional regulator, LuxR family [Desulfotignum phosphitoxidans DSM 13687]